MDWTALLTVDRMADATPARVAPSAAAVTGDVERVPDAVAVTAG